MDDQEDGNMFSLLKYFWAFSLFVALFLFQHVSGSEKNYSSRPLYKKNKFMDIEANFSQGLET